MKMNFEEVSFISAFFQQSTAAVPEKVSKKSTTQHFFAENDQNYIVSVH